MRKWFTSLLTVAALAVAGSVEAQSVETSTQTETYPDGSTRSQETTTSSPDGSVKYSTTRTEYDKDGRPTSETETSYRDGQPDQTHEKTWVYDDKGRLIYFESTDSARGTVVGGTVQRYRVRKKYKDDNDKTGTNTSEEVYGSATGKWRDFDGEGGDTAPSTSPLQPLKPRKTDGDKKPSSSADDGLPPPPLPKTKIAGGYSWMHAPDEEAQNLSGFNISVAVDLNITPRIFAVGHTPRVSVVGDLTSVTGSATQTIFGTTFDTSLHRFVYMAGPQLTFTTDTSVSPFVRAMVGGARDTTTVGTANISANALAMGFGGGVDIDVGRHLSSKIGFDFVSTRFGGAWQPNVRLITDIVFEFGGTSDKP